ncbi:MAG: DedA family protein [Opitutales bacterium]|nr:DedA family protein [Opitutales bacterium]
MHDLFKGLFDWYNQSLATGGYPLIVLLMAIESSIVPLPSELIIPPAILVAQRSGNMTFLGIVLAGALGSWLGATVMYWVSRWAGRPLVLRYGKFIFVPPAKVEQAERWAARFGSFGIFASRLLPVVRHLIGIPAGIVRMNYLTFSIFTVIGSAVWCAVLCWVGIQAGKDAALMRGELHQVTLWAVGALAVLGVIYYFFVHRFTREPSR